MDTQMHTRMLAAASAGLLFGVLAVAGVSAHAGGEVVTSNHVTAQGCGGGPEGGVGTWFGHAAHAAE
ncbi:MULTISPECIES: hypothetical protein [unclassified Ornithinimicrobium]|uniref:hypothetical protein n=1 Tax=unclassified Ornithinimicrobium TaxID=2615080 RepID=UPI0038534D27